MAVLFFTASRVPVSFKLSLQTVPSSICSAHKHINNRHYKFCHREVQFHHFCWIWFELKNGMHLHWRHLADALIQRGSQWVSRRGVVVCFKDTLAGSRDAGEHVVCWRGEICDLSALQRPDDADVRVMMDGVGGVCMLSLYKSRWNYKKLIC